MIRKVKFLFLLLSLGLVCYSAKAEGLNLTPVDKVVIMEISGETAYPTGKSERIVKRLGKIRETGRQQCPIGGKGVAYIVDVYNKGKKRTFLFDTGSEGIILEHNFPYFRRDTNDIEVIAISHGHSDHYGGINSVTKMMKAKKVPVIVGSEDAFNVRMFFKNGKVNGTWTWHKDANSKAEFIIAKQPRLLLGGEALFTGPIPRKIPYEGVKTPWRKVVDGKLVKDVMPEDSAAVFNVAGKGLVVLSSCDHSGLINTLKYAKAVTGVEKVYAYMGSIQKVTDVANFTRDVKANKPHYFISTHCAQNKPKLLRIVKETMKDGYFFSKVGSEFTFDSKYKE